MYRLGALVLCICLLLVGCGDNADAVQEQAQNNIIEGFEMVTGEQIPISYEVPVSSPNILVNRLGYEPTGNKTAVFKGEELPEQFTVRSVASGKIVYTGNIIEKGYDDYYREYDSYGDFSDFKEVGNFYIQADRIGESYPFMIYDNLYYSLLQQACRQFHSIRGTEGWNMEEKGNNREIAACNCIYRLLLSYELFPEIYTDDTGISESGNGIPDILDECMYEAKWLMDEAQINPEADGIANGYRASVLAKMAYEVKSFDRAFASVCQKAAEEAWADVSRDKTVEAQIKFLAATELYRLTNGAQYHGQVREYLGSRINMEEELAEPEFDGCVTYLNTNGKVDMELCGRIMKKIMEEAETITYRAKQQNYMVYFAEGMDGNEAILAEMMKIGTVNHIITNHEYNTVMENHFHYLMGRNPKGICGTSAWDGKPIAETDIMNHPRENAAFVFMLSGLLGNR